MTYRLFVDSSTGIDVEPEYDFEQTAKKEQSMHRTPTGKKYKYTWGTWQKFEFSVMYVNSSYMSIVNSWWENNTELLFMKTGGTQVYSIRVEGNDAPIRNVIAPYDDLFEGTIVLETY